MNECTCSENSCSTAMPGPHGPRTDPSTDELAKADGQTGNGSAESFIVKAVLRVISAVSGGLARSAGDGVIDELMDGEEETQ
ncbi:hypothetical protein ACFYS8_00805 [Kitasatospora sp. NPDC004615]|uniref:hypothetical protein n=1 Tax=Kitasatospora sp. NPDC004615 TaxID=3364017 RepID=UPI0036C7CC9D